MPYKDPKKQKEWFRNRHLRNKEEIRIIKSSPCTDCLKNFPTYVMEFDHVPERGKKKMNMAALAGSRKLTSNGFITELKKCDLVCANCHRIRTFTRK